MIMRIAIDTFKSVQNTHWLMKDYIRDELNINYKRIRDKLNLNNEKNAAELKESVLGKVNEDIFFKGGSKGK